MAFGRRPAGLATSRSGRLPLAVVEAFARLREVGVTGSNDSLAVLLEEAHCDVDRAANLFWERQDRPFLASLGEVCQASAPGKAVVATRSLGEDDPGHSDEERLLGENGPASASRRNSGRRAAHLPEARTMGSVDSLGSTASSVVATTSKGSGGYAQATSGRRGRQHIRISLLRTEGHAQPTGVHYEVGVSESYDVDVVKMSQTHIETGNVRKVVRERPGGWRFCRRGGSSKYPDEVCTELERIFLALGRPSGSWERPEPHGASGVDAAAVASRALPLGVIPVAKDLAGLTLNDVVELERSLPAGSLCDADLLDATRSLLFAAVEASASSGAGSESKVAKAACLAAPLIAALSQRHGLRCTADDARRAGLLAGSMRLLRAVLVSSPDLNLVGVDIFDRKYTKLRLNEPGRKNCIKCLLARGMRFGSSECTPSSKLLRKLEGDADPQWADRYLDSMMRACPALPENLPGRVRAFLFEENERPDLPG